MGKKVTSKNFRKVTENFLKYLESRQDKAAINLYCGCLNDILDEFLNDDFFGTEGQNDPRGDYRG